MTDMRETYAGLFLGSLFIMVMLDNLWLIFLAMFFLTLACRPQRVSKH